MNTSNYNYDDINIDISKSCSSNIKLKENKYFIDKVNKAFYNDFVFF